jgi:hypothetical protein
MLGLLQREMQKVVDLLHFGRLSGKETGSNRAPGAAN